MCVFKKTPKAHSCDLAELDNEANYYSVTCCWLVVFGSRLAQQAEEQPQHGGCCRLDNTTTTTWNLMDRTETETFHSTFHRFYQKRKKKSIRPEAN